MKSISILLSCTLLSALGCNEEYDTPEEEEEYVEVTDDEGSDPVPPPPSSGNQEPSSIQDNGFDPCPSDTYILWSGDGSEYVIEIQVFCEPKKVFNTGCPEPGY